MIVRVWHGWTDPADADAYERFLVGDDGFLDSLSGEGFLGYDVLRREVDDDGGDGADADEVEFVTQIRFADYDTVAEFAGENYEEAHVPEEARKLLSRWEEEATHYELRGEARE